MEGIPGTVAKFSRRSQPVAAPRQPKKHAPRAERGSTGVHKLAVPGGGGGGGGGGAHGAGAQRAGAGQTGKAVSCVGSALFPRVGENGI